ncbi:TolC family protein [Flavobacteriaceae bacterium F08102]|nr:TolC family protein [Flavobacteriaceae bacterium F08102]
MRTKITQLFVFLLTLHAVGQEKKWGLEEMVTYALQHNLSVLQADHTTELRKQDIASAKGNRLPGVSGSVGQNFSFGSGIEPISGNRQSVNTRSTNMGLNTSVTLFDGFNLKYSVLQSELAYQASLFDLQKMKDDISLVIVNSYLNVLFNKESLAIAKEQLEITKQQLVRTKELVDAGVLPKGNLLEVEATLANDESAIVAAENSLDLSLLSLSQILQIPNKDFNVEDIDVNIESVALMYNDTDEIFMKALEERPEIKSAEIRLENAENSIKIAKSSYLPSLSLSAGISTGYSHLYGNPDVFNFSDQLDNNLGQSVGLNLSIPIFSRGQVKASVNRALINKEITEISLENAKLTLREDIEQAFINARGALKEYQAAVKSVKAQEQAFVFAQERYNLGDSTSFDFEQVRNRLAKVKSDLSRAKYNFVFRTKLLEFYYGIPIVLE